MGIVRISITPVMVNAPPPRPRARNSRWRAAVDSNKKAAKRLGTDRSELYVGWKRNAVQPLLFGLHGSCSTLGEIEVELENIIIQPCF